MEYFNDYLDTVESLPMELSRSYTLLKELDSQSNEILLKTELETTEFLTKIKNSKISKKERINLLKQTEDTFKECLKYGEEKLALATQTYEMVERHVNRLDEDLKKFEQEVVAVCKKNGRYAVDGMGEEKNSGNNTASTGKRKNNNKTVIESTSGRAKRRRAGQSNEDDLQNQNDEPLPDKLNALNDAKQLARSNSVGGTPKKEKNSSKEKDSILNNGKDTTFRESKKKENNINLSIEDPVQKSNRTGSRRKDPNIQKNETGSTSKEVKDIRDIKPRSPNDLPVDPNEPVYCICDRVSFGEMIACDNEDCEKEWFHYECVNLDGPPKGKWFCPNCKEMFK